MDDNKLAGIPTLAFAIAVASGCTTFILLEPFHLTTIFNSCGHIPFSTILYHRWSILLILLIRRRCLKISPQTYAMNWFPFVLFVELLAQFVFRVAYSIFFTLYFGWTISLYDFPCFCNSLRTIFIYNPKIAECIHKTLLFHLMKCQTHQEMPCNHFQQKFNLFAGLNVNPDCYGPTVRKKHYKSFAVSVFQFNRYCDSMDGLPWKFHSLVEYRLNEISIRK